MKEIKLTIWEVAIEWIKAILPLPPIVAVTLLAIHYLPEGVWLLIFVPLLLVWYYWMMIVFDIPSGGAE